MPRAALAAVWAAWTSKRLRTKKTRARSGPSWKADTINRWIEEERRVQVFVRDNNVDQALKVLKKKMQREGIFREMKLRGHYRNPLKRKRGRRRKLFAAPASSRARKCSARACTDETRDVPGAPGKGAAEPRPPPRRQANFPEAAPGEDRAGGARSFGTSLFLEFVIFDNRAS